MARSHMTPAEPLLSGAETTSAEERLEHGEILFLPSSPFPLPAGPDHEFLLAQRVTSLGRKNISYNPQTDTVSGFAWHSKEQAEHLRLIFSDFSRTIVSWLAEALPRYRGACHRDRASFRPEEEATRRLRTNARNDLLHVDAFPNRPARGRRILRVYANLNPTEPRVWATSEPLPHLVSRYAQKAERARRTLWQRLAGVRDLFRPVEQRRAPSDVFMERLHDYLKHNLKFQQKGPRRLWKFPPGSVWLAMTDGCCHAELRGRFAMEHSFFIAPQALVRPELAPAAINGAA